MCRVGCSTTAAATTGPARQPRPTSSTPATYTNPMRRSAFSRVRYARTLDMKRLLRFSHPRGLALQVAQEVQLRAPDLRGADHFDLVDDRRVQRKDALHALAERHFADRERGARPAAVLPDHHALEHLDALLVPLAHLHVHAHGVARLDRRAFGQLAALDGLYGSHDNAPFSRFSLILTHDPADATASARRQPDARRAAPPELLRLPAPGRRAAPRPADRDAARACGSTPRAGAIARSPRDGPTAAPAAPHARGTPRAARTARSPAILARTCRARPTHRRRRRRARTARAH